jgi:hypothetical protein
MFALRPVTFRYDWKAPYTANRAKFVRAFYDYARANPNGRPKLWSEWLKSGDRGVRLHRKKVDRSCNQRRKATTRNRAKSGARSQAREQFLMDVVEPAITENRDHVFWPKQRNDSVHNRIGIFLIEGGPTGLRD